MKLSNKKMWLYLLVLAVVATWGLKAVLPESVVSQTNGTIDFLHLYFFIILATTITGLLRSNATNKLVTTDKKLKYALSYDGKDTRKRSLFIVAIGVITLSLTLHMVLGIIVAVMSLLMAVLYQKNSKTQDGLYDTHLVYRGQAHQLDQMIEFKKTQDGFRFSFIKPLLGMKVLHVVEFKLIVDVEHFTSLVKEISEVDKAA